MSEDQFDFLLERVSLHISKSDTNMGQTSSVKFLIADYTKLRVILKVRIEKAYFVKYEEDNLKKIRLSKNSCTKIILINSGNYKIYQKN